MLGGSQLLNWFSTRFSTTRFPQWEPIDTRKCENPTENRPQVLIWPRAGYENRFKCIHIYIYIYILGNRTGSLIELKSGSQSSVYHLLVPLVVLLVPWDCYSSFYCYYCSPIITVLSLLGLTPLFITVTFFPISLILFLLLLLFSHGAALFVWWSHLIINLFKY